MIKNILVITSLLVLSVINIAHAQEKILNFHSDVTIQLDGSMIVEESITVKSERRDIRRGIYREFPTNYRDKLGNNYQVDFDVLSITRDDKDEPWHFRRLDNGVRMYLGSKDYILPPAEYTYNIRYRTTGQINFNGELDELYWNVNGTGWKFVIDQLSATIHLPGAFGSRQLEAIAYTGLQGQSNSDYTQHIASNGVVSFASTRPFMPTENMTISVAWPKGVVTAPTEADKFQRIVEQNHHVFALVIGFILVFFYYFMAWMKVGRDPIAGPIMPIYNPPEDVSPAAMRYVTRMGYDQKTFTTALISLAVKGYLTIDATGFKKSGKVFSFRKTGKEVNFSAGEKALVEPLFAFGKSIETLQKHHTIFRAAMEAHRQSLKQNFNQSFFKRNGFFGFIGVLSSIASFIVAAIFIHPFADPVIAFVISAILFIVLNAVFIYLLKAPTKQGRDFLDKAEGLKEYLTLAESDDLRTRYPLEKTPEAFERYLPYAFALGIDKTWVDRFDSVLKDAFVDPNGKPQSTPFWYHGKTQNMTSLNAMGSDISSSMATSIASASTSPDSSSGTGGGGFSGGGGGGGGGGGW